MSISSIAEDSALRLTAPPPAPEIAADEAARTTAEAMQAGAPPEQARIAGKEAGTNATGASVSVSSTVLAQLVSFIPTETITLYVAAQSALGDVKAPAAGAICRADFGGRWLWLWGMAVATVLLCVGLSYRKQKDANPNDPFKLPIVETAAATAAFIVWALSLNNSPLRDFCGYNYESWNPVLLLGGTIAIAAIAYILRRTISWQKVVTA
jgi:hypothetical protein